MDALDDKVGHAFKAYLRKDLTRRLKAEWPDVPAFVLEYYLAKYCSTADETARRMGEEVVRKTLTEKFVTPSRRAAALRELREQGRGEVLDRVSIQPEGAGFRARLDFLQERDVRVPTKLVERLLGSPGLTDSGIWAEVRLRFEPSSESIAIEDLRPVELASFDLEEFRAGRARLELDEWIDLLVRTLGYDSQEMPLQAKRLLLCRLLPFVEPNLNVLEIGPAGRGKSYLFAQFSPFAALIDTPRVSSARIFGHAASTQPGLVGKFDVVVFDPGQLVDRMPGEVVALLSRYATTGEYERGKNVGHGRAGLVFLVDEVEGIATGAIPRVFRQDAELLSSIDFLVPSQLLPPLGPEQATEHLGLPLEYLGKALRALRAVEGRDPLLNFECGAMPDRDRRAISRVFTALLKLLFPHREPTAEERVELLATAAEGRGRVKELLRRGGAVGDLATKFSFIDRASRAPLEIAVGTSVERLVSAEDSPPGVLVVAGVSPRGVVALQRLEVNVVPGQGELEILGRPHSSTETSIRAALGFAQENAHALGVADELSQSRVQVQAVDLIGNDEPLGGGVGAFLAICSALREIPVPAGTVVVGDMTVKGSLVELKAGGAPTRFLAASGAKEIWAPDSAGVHGSAGDAEGARRYASPKHLAKLIFGDALVALPPSDAWTATLPYPLASILDLYESAADPSMKYRALLAFFESLAAFHAIVLLSALAEEPDHSATLAVLGGALNFETGTFGLWRETFANLAKRVRGQRDSNREALLRLFGTARVAVLDQVSSPELTSVFEETNRLRNDWKGHDSVALSDEHALVRVERLLQILSRARRATPTVWSSYELVRQRRIDYEDGRWRCTVDRLRGPNPNFKPFTIDTSGPMDKKALYLVDRDVRRAVRVVPLLRIDQRNIAYYYDRRDARGIRWLSQHSREFNQVFEDTREAGQWLNHMKAQRKAPRETDA